MALRGILIPFVFLGVPMAKDKFPYQLIDLTHTLSEETLSWDGGCGFNHDIKLDYDECDSAVG